MLESTRVSSCSMPRKLQWQVINIAATAACDAESKKKILLLILLSAMIFMFASCNYGRRLPATES
jgi:hypothetical protein